MNAAAAEQKIAVTGFKLSEAIGTASMTVRFPTMDFTGTQTYYCVKGKAHKGVEIKTLGEDPLASTVYVSTAFKEKKKPRIKISSTASIKENHAKIRNEILGHITGQNNPPVNLVAAFIYTACFHLKANTGATEWESFGVKIAPAETEITPLDLLEVELNGEELKLSMGVSSEVYTERMDIAILGILCLPNRVKMFKDNPSAQTYLNEIVKKGSSQIAMEE